MVLLLHLPHLLHLLLFMLLIPTKLISTLLKSMVHNCLVRLQKNCQIKKSFLSVQTRPNKYPMFSKLRHQLTFGGLVLQRSLKNIMLFQISVGTRYFVLIKLVSSLLEEMLLGVGPKSWPIVMMEISRIIF